MAIIIPCFNEEAGLPQLQRQLEPVLVQLEATYSVELIFIDDGSTDGTAVALHRLFPSANVICHGRNRGPGAAMRTGATSTTADLVVYADADCTYPPREIPALLTALSEGVDVVTASPYHPRGGVEGVPATRLVLSRGLSLIYRLVVGSAIYTYTSMFRVYRRPILDDVTHWSDGFVAIAETLIFPILAGRVVHEYPTVLHRRRYGSSSIRIARTIRAHLGLILLVVAERIRSRLRTAT